MAIKATLKRKGSIWDTLHVQTETDQVEGLAALIASMTVDNLDDIVDVVITDPSDGQVITRSGVNWVNGAANNHTHTKVQITDFGSYEPANANIQAHIGTVTGNPHNLDATDVGARASTWVPSWTDITSKPETFAPIIGSTGTTAVAGNDARLTDARTPLSHTLASHTVSGLTTGHFLKATGTGAFAFAAHGLTASDVSARASTWVPLWTDVTNKPTDIVYDTDFASDGILKRTSEGVYGIVTDNSGNWNTAYGWGNHSGLYRPVAWVPEWADVTSKPTTLLGYGITDARTATQITTEIGSAVSALVDSSPGTLDTLNELAAALGDDENFATTMTTAIGTKEPAITKGTTSQYFRGDMSLATFPTSMAPTSHTLLGHTASGLTTGDFLKATGTGAFGFAAHGLTLDDISAGTTNLHVIESEKNTWNGKSDFTTVEAQINTYNTYISTSLSRAESAYGWGNHAGVYRPVAWVPAWTDVTSKPLTFAPIIGSGAADAVAGNDTRLTNARPASDVQTWAKAASQPAPIAHNQAWSTITTTPTTLAGYGITEGLTANNFELSGTTLIITV